MSNWIDWPIEFTLSVVPDFAVDFPNLHPHLCNGQVSLATRSYNCIAWAASVTADRWEPDAFDQYYWPDDAPREYTLPAYIEAYRTIGFEVCDDASLQEGIEKIALYTLMGSCEHAARQLENGNWTTKFGDYEDVEHVNLECLSGPLYGNPQVYMGRLRR